MKAQTIEPAPPPAMASLPLDKHGRRIPWFVHREEDGTPDHRLPHKTALRDAYRFKLCWLCGQPYGRWVAFAIGPMCAINRVSAEPPSHHACAEYAAQSCPFLTTPAMRRRTTGLPEEKVVIGGLMAERNPGVVALWTTRDWHVSQEYNGYLFRLGEPSKVEWYTRGSVADRTAVLAALDSGRDFLRQYNERASDDAELDAVYQKALVLLPAV